ncbi:MAG TPA: UvrB/UvrC motif-containing protein [Pirellulaceae bacterium]|nr:UvrB/UvrC motif-containing protein [Pirellulaceae bacterium]
MARKENIDRLLRDWPYDPEGISVRKKKGDDGRDVLQMRLDLGLLQLEATGRPDGQRPEGAESFYDLLVGKSVASGNGYMMTEDECEEADREFMQYYHRRVCWLALREFHNAVADADHTLGLMDFCRDHSPDEQWTLSHEQYRPFVLFHRSQAAALAALGDRGAEAAVEEINKGLDRMRHVFVEYEAEEEFDEDELVQRLTELRESLRQHFRVGRTLQEQLAEAIADEKYELAAEIRDELNRRDSRAR